MSFEIYRRHMKCVSAFGVAIHGEHCYGNPSYSNLTYCPLVSPTLVSTMTLALTIYGSLVGLTSLQHIISVVYSTSYADSFLLNVGSLQLRLANFLFLEVVV